MSAHAKLWILLAVLLIACPRIASAQDDNADCPGALPRRLLVGGTARVVSSSMLRMRAEPRNGGARLGDISAGSEVEVRDGPVCADGAEWWQVYAVDGSGWVEEGVGAYFLEPVFDVGTMLLPNAGGPLHYQGVTLTVDPALAHTLAALYTPAHLALDNPDDWVASSELEHTTITLLGYPDRVFGSTARGPAITVTSTADFALVPISFADSETPVDVLADLQTLLAERPDLAAFERLPFFRRGNIAEVFTAQAAYVETDTFTGIRYLTSLSQGTRYITNEVIFYHFDGITRDGASYVSASFPVNASTLPDAPPPDLATMADHDAYMDAHPTYRQDIVAALNTQAVFMPPLESLDALIAGIRIDTAQADDCPGALPPRLVVGDTARVTQQVGLNMRAEPGTGAAQVGWIPTNGEVQVLEGPVCAAGYLWWRVSFEGATGWAAEGADDYWLEPGDPAVG